jgi:hypothetical protein
MNHDIRQPTPTESALAWVVNIKVASDVSRHLTGNAIAGSLAAIVAMVVAEDRGLQNMGLFSAPAAVLLTPGSVVVNVLRQQEAAKIEPCCPDCPDGTPCEDSNGPAH